METNRIKPTDISSSQNFFNTPLDESKTLNPDLSVSEKPGFLRGLLTPSDRPKLDSKTLFATLAEAIKQNPQAIKKEIVEANLRHLRDGGMLGSLERGNLQSLVDSALKQKPSVE